MTPLFLSLSLFAPGQPPAGWSHQGVQNPTPPGGFPPAVEVQSIRSNLPAVYGNSGTPAMPGGPGATTAAKVYLPVLQPLVGNGATTHPTPVSPAGLVRAVRGLSPGGHVFWVVHPRTGRPTAVRFDVPAGGVGGATATDDRIEIRPLMGSRVTRIDLLPDGTARVTNPD